MHELLAVRNKALAMTFRARFTSLRSSGSERGNALLEFAICCLFLVPLTTAVIDISSMLNQYMTVAEAVHSGIRYGSQLAQLPEGTYQVLTDTGFCPRQGSSEFHYRLAQRIAGSAQSNNSRTDPQNMCIETEVRNEGGNKKLYVRVRFVYQGFFPAFGASTIRLEAVGPSLS